MSKDSWEFSAADKAILDLVLNQPEQTVMSMIVNSKKSTPSESVRRLADLRREIGQRLYDIEQGVYGLCEDFVEGQMWVAQQSVMGYQKGEEYPVTRVLENEVVIDGMIPMKKEEVRKYFLMKFYKSEK